MPLERLVRMEQKKRQQLGRRERQEQKEPLVRREHPVRKGHQEQMEHPVRTVPLELQEQMVRSARTVQKERMLPRKLLVPTVQTVQKQPGQQVHQELPVHLERLGHQASAGHRHWWLQR